MGERVKKVFDLRKFRQQEYRKCSYSDLNAADTETCSSPNLNETYFNNFLFFPIYIPVAHAAYECFQCSYSDLNAADEETCSSPNLNETSTWTECPVGCYDFDAVFKINDGGGKHA